MAENENGEEKTEQATDKKRKDARKKGQVLKSQDVAVVCSLFLTFFVLRVTAPTAFDELAGCMKKYVSAAGLGIGDMNVISKEAFIRELVTDLVKSIAIISGAVLIASFAVAIISTGVQTRFLVSFENLKFNLSKLNPINGIKRMFSLKSVFELAKSILKLVILLVVVYNEISDRFIEIIRLMQISPVNSIIYIAEAIFSIVMTLGMVFTAVAAIDFLFQRYSYENELKMTKQEVKDEFKQMEGDPKVKGKRRSIQMQMAQQRMMQEVPSADVIIRNPTHFAVAIKYDPYSKAAPVIVAKGKDMVALRIVDKARENNVPDVENKPLARSLYEKVDIGREIPVEFYQSVAEVLWFVYNLKGKPINDKLRPVKQTTPYNY